jgi:hypothetical protein
MLAAPVMIVVLYLLRRRFLPRQVPSVFLWRKSVRDYAANRPFQRLMKNLLLPLQVLAALTLALALMRPALPGGTAGRSVFIFDISGSMQAESGGRSRLEAAKEEALKRIGELPAEEEITMITAGDEVQRLGLNGNREEAEKVIASMTCGRGGADIDRALTLARALGQTEGGSEGDRKTLRITIFSDALRLSDLRTKGGSTVSIINVGESAENRAVYSLTAENGKAYARAANFGKDCTVTLVCEADATLCGASEITIPAGETAGASFDIPEGTERVRVSIREKDALEADNTAEAAVKHDNGLRVAVTEDNVFLESALKVRPNLTVMRTEAEALASTEADLYILGSDPLILTTRKPEEGYDPAASGFGVFGWEDKETSTSARTTESPAAEVLESPLTDGVTMKNVFFHSWHPISGGRTAVRLGEDPVIVWTEDAAVLGFDLHETNLPLKYDFPVLVQNILNTLLKEEQAAEETAAKVMPLSESDTRDTAPSAEAEQNERTNEQGRELKDILLLLFLLLLVAEMGVSRYVG